MDPMTKPSNPVPDDQEEVMNHVALEAMHAIGAGDHQSFRQAHHVLVADILNKMSSEMEAKESGE